MRVLIAARDVRVRGALSRLLELDGHRIVGATDAPHLLLQLAARLSPDVVVLELDRGEDVHDLRVVERVTRGGRAVIGVSSGTAQCAAVIAAGARECLDKDADVPDRLAEAVRAVAVARLPAPPA